MPFQIYLGSYTDEQLLSLLMSILEVMPESDVIGAILAHCKDDDALRDELIAQLKGLGHE